LNGDGLNDANAVGLFEVDVERFYDFVVVFHLENVQIK
jgi:hypothetical protein